MRKSGISMLSLAAMAATIGLAGAASAAEPVRPLLTQKLDETRLVRLRGSVIPAARDTRNDRGLVADDLKLEHIQILLQRPAIKEADLIGLIDAQHNPQSPQFHQWLTPAQYGARYGVATSDIAQVSGWLKVHGFTVNALPANHMVIDFTGTAGQVREAFHTEMHNLEVKGEKHISNMSSPEIPEALSPVVRGISSLNNFHPKPMLRQVVKTHIQPGTGNLVKAEAQLPGKGLHADYTTAEGDQLVVPHDLETIYNINPVYAAGISGEGQTVAVLEDTDLYSSKDWTTFRSVFGLIRYSLGTLATVHPGGCTDPGVNGDDGEAILDAEYASAAAPSAHIVVASCADSQVAFGPVLALQGLINGSKPPAIVSISYGGCESGNGEDFNALVSSTYQQAAAEGVSVFVSSGDDGAASCDAHESYALYGVGVSSLAATPYNVAVGGTDFGDTYNGTNEAYWNTKNASTFQSAKSYIPEIPWNNSCAGTLLSNYVTGSPVAYGGSGFCNSDYGQNFLEVVAGSGGPSTCATGTPAIDGFTDGTCKGAPKPSWQTGVLGIPADKVRDIPDVSLFAANGLWGHYYVVCYTDPNYEGSAPCTGAPDTWSGFGGTSISSPIMAGIQSLVNQKAGEAQGNPNPTYYKLAAKEYGTKGSSACNSSLGNKVSSACTFYDVRQGDITVDCVGNQNCYAPASGPYGVLSTSLTSYKPAYATGLGYDLATGIGSVNVYNLVNNWKTVTPTSKPK